MKRFLFSATIALPSIVTSQVPTASAAAAALREALGGYAQQAGPGCAGAVYTSRTTLAAMGFGLADLERPTPITDSTLFDVGSMAKQFTAMSVELLIADGKLRREDRASRYLTWLPPSAREVTIAHLLHHTSGLRDYIELMELGGVRLEGVGTREDAIAVIARQARLEFAPGTRHDYSNSNYFLLGEIVRAVAGSALPEFARQRIFEPLGMADTRFNDDHTRIIPNRGISYQPRAGGGYALLISQFEQVGDGGMFTSVRDLARWYAGFHSPSAAFAGPVARMQQRTRLVNGDSVDYASGIWVAAFQSTRMIYHPGGWAAYRADLVQFPDHDLAVAVLCNRDDVNPTGLAQRVARALIPALSTTTAAPLIPQPDSGFSLTAEARRALVGTYRDLATDQVRGITVRDTSLWLSFGNGAVRLVALGPGRFRTGNSRTIVTVTPQSDGRRRVDLVRPTGNNEAYVSFTPARPSGATMRQYVGDYFSLELDATYRVEVTGDTVVLHRPHLPTRRLVPSRAGVFVDGDARLEFQRAADGNVGFDYAEGRVSQIRFYRSVGRPGARR